MVGENSEIPAQSERHAPQSEALSPSGSLRFADKSLIVLFLAAIAAPLADGWLRPSTERATQAEHRRPNPPPTFEWTTASLVDFPRRFNLWYGDTFGLRDKLVRLHNASKWFVLGVSPTPTLVVGEEDWAFFTWNNSIDVYRGVAPLTPAELEDWRVLLEYRREWLERRGIHYLFALAPDKAEIYPEMLPERFDRVGRTRRELLLEHMAAHSAVDVVDLTPRLLEERRHDGGRDDHVFYRLGIHWTDRGLLVGYQGLVERLQARFPGMQAWSRCDYELRPAQDEGDSWARRLYMEDLLPQHPFDLVALRKRQARFVNGFDAVANKRRYEYVNAQPGLPVCLLMGDSFSEPMSEFLAEHFSRTWGYRSIAFDAKLIELHRPDVVIQLFNERCLVAQDPRQMLEQARLKLGPLDCALPADPEPDTRVHGPALDPQARFAEATDVRLALDLTRADLPLEACGRTEIQRLEGDAHGLVIRTHSAEDGFYLPGFEFPAGPSLLRMEITSPADTTLDVIDQSQAGRGAFEPELRRGVRLTQGTNAFFVYLVDPGQSGRLIVRPGRVAGRFVLHGLEVRAVGN